MSWETVESHILVPGAKLSGEALDPKNPRIIALIKKRGKISSLYLHSRFFLREVEKKSPLYKNSIYWGDL